MPAVASKKLTLTDRRRARYENQQTVAVNAKVHRTYISRLEAGIFQPAINKIPQLAVAYGCTPQEFEESLIQQLRKR